MVWAGHMLDRSGLCWRVRPKLFLFTFDYAGEAENDLQKYLRSAKIAVSQLLYSMPGCCRLSVKPPTVGKDYQHSAVHDPEQNRELVLLATFCLFAHILALDRLSPTSAHRLEGKGENWRRKQENQNLSPKRRGLVVCHMTGSVAQTLQSQ